jgi:hypothetical protein
MSVRSVRSRNYPAGIPVCSITSAALSGMTSKQIARHGTCGASGTTSKEVARQGAFGAAHGAAGEIRA